jgi:hypothetical protein
MAQRLLSALTVALCLFALGAASTAEAHPGGSAISLGSNPIRSASGEVDLDVTTYAANVISAPSGQDLVLTDIILGMAQENAGAKITGTIVLEDGSGTRLAGYAVRAASVDQNFIVGVSQQYAGPTGIVVPAGSSVTIRWQRLDGDLDGYFNVMYTLSGYLVQP